MRSTFPNDEQRPGPYGAGDDQVRALRVRASVCTDGSAAGSAGDEAHLADAAADCLDCGGDGRSPVGGDDHESHRGFALRQGEPADEAARAGDWGADGRVRVALHACSTCRVLCSGMAIESTGTEACATGNCDFVFLFLHQKIHELVASFSGIRAGDFACRGVDCDYGHARLADGDSLRRRDAVGGRVRRAVCVPGHCLRPRGWVVFNSEAIRNCKSTADWARNAQRRDCAVELAGPELRIAVAGVGGNRGGRGAARIRTFARPRG